MTGSSVATLTDFVSLADLERRQLEDILRLAREIKDDWKRDRQTGAARLTGKSLAMIFHKPSLRTRVSFEVGMTQLGGAGLDLAESSIGLGTREAVGDVGRVLSGYVDAIMIRTFSHALVRELAGAATVPVINGLDDLVHPCQVLADLFTLLEEGLDLDGLPVAYLGDGNNVAHSWVNAAALVGIDLRLAVPAGHEPDPGVLDAARKRGARVTVTQDVMTAARDARVLYTDVWASMGQEAEAEKRRALFRPYQLNKTVVAAAHPACVVLHCLPAHRGEEITDEVIDGPHSRVFPQAENRLHAQKGLLAILMDS